MMGRRERPATWAELLDPRNHDVDHGLVPVRRATRANTWADKVLGGAALGLGVIIGSAVVTLIVNWVNR